MVAARKYGSGDSAGASGNDLISRKDTLMRAIPSAMSPDATRLP